MHDIRTWAELDIFLSGARSPDLTQLLRTRRDQLMEYGDLSDLGSLVIIERDDTLADIEWATGWPVLMDGQPTFEWVQRHRGIFEMPFVLSDAGTGHVLFVPDADDIDPALLQLCCIHADQAETRQG
ncbi:hypothetical protein [Sphingobium abikonense]|uniref:hypothetical protein n=1 Tax=Sphingobium abikonense TaxID=86193 RepID=UPI003515CB19